MKTPVAPRLLVRGLAGLGAVACATAGFVAPALASPVHGAGLPTFARTFADTGPRAVDAGTTRLRLRSVASVTAKPLAGRASAEQVLQLLAGPAGGSVTDASTAIAAGPKQVLLVTSQKAQVFTKTTGKPAGAATSLRALFGVNASVDVSQPQVAYDVIGKRFVLAALADQSGDVGVLVRVSKGSSPTSWYPVVRYASAAGGDPHPATVESLPRLGLSSDKVVLTMAASDPGDATTAARTLIIDKAKLESGGAPDAWIAENNVTYSGQVPAVNASATASAYVAVPDFDPITSNDLTTLVYTWNKPDTAPHTAKLVVYPASPVVAPPVVPQPGGGAPDLVVGNGEFQTAAWRNNQLWIATTVACPSNATLACVRVFGVNTLTTALTDETLTPAGLDRFVPALAVDAAGVVHVGYSLSSPGSTGPGYAVAARQAANRWSTRVVVDPSTVVAYESADWAASSAATLDPSATYDVWLAAAVASSTAAAPANWETRVVRASLTTFGVTFKASAKRVHKGRSVTFNGKVTRPTGSQALAGVAVRLQAKPKGSGKWKTVTTIKTPGSGKVHWTVKVKRTADYRLLVPAVGGSVGRTWSKVVGPTKRVTAT